MRPSRESPAQVPAFSMEAPAHFQGYAIRYEGSSDAARLKPNRDDTSEAAAAVSNPAEVQKCVDITSASRLHRSFWHS
jgi:hypothetical protein